MRGKRVVAIGLVVAIVVAVAWGCGGSGPAPEPTPEPVQEPVMKTALADLNGTTWILVALDAGNPAPEEPEVTLAFEGPRIAGSSGCNRYSGEMTEAEPGSVSVGPVAGTRMACDETAMDLEMEFLQRLGKVVGVELRSDGLALVWDDEGSIAALLFSPASEPIE